MIEDYLRKIEIGFFLKNVVSFIRFWLNLNRIYKYAQRVTINRISSHVSFSIILFRKSQQVFFRLLYQYENYLLFLTLKPYPIRFLYIPIFSESVAMRGQLESQKQQVQTVKNEFEQQKTMVAKTKEKLEKLKQDC